jgi:hypothetical protein
MDLTSHPSDGANAPGRYQDALSFYRGRFGSKVHPSQGHDGSMQDVGMTAEVTRSPRQRWRSDR